MFLLMELCGDGLLQMRRFVAVLRNNMVRRVEWSLVRGIHDACVL